MSKTPGKKVEESAKIQEVRRPTPRVESAVAVKREGRRKIPVVWFVLFGIIAFLVVAVFGLWLNQKDTIKLTKEDKEVAGKIQTGTLTSEDLEKLAPGGLKEYEKLTGETVRRGTTEAVKPVAPEVPAGFKTGNWNETFQTKDGPLKVSYSITPTLKDAVKSRPAIEENGELRIYLRNFASESVSFIVLLVWKDKNGQVIETVTQNRDYPPGYESDEPASSKGATIVTVSVK